MTRTALLNNVDHGKLRVIARHGSAYGDSVNQALVFPTEFAAIQREYPILLFKEGGGAFQAVALLGLDRDENLFLDAQGWHARVVPAVHQRGPFLIGPSHGIGGDPKIHIDLDDPRVSESEGEPLFLPQGGNAPYLQRVIRALVVIHEGVDLGRRLYPALEAAGLIEPVNVEIQLSEREQYNLADYYSVSAEKLASLGGGELQSLNMQGFLLPAFLMLASLDNVSRLIELKQRKREP
ncbi:MAG: SapC family protein [Hyphomonadaceae bacterium]|nr:SapC family protein [Hyphomonadaceae bacterium]